MLFIVKFHIERGYGLSPFSVLVFGIPEPLQESLRPLRQSLPGVSRRVSPKIGVSEGVSQEESSGALLAPGFGVSKGRPETVPGVSRTDIPGTLRMVLGTPEPGAP